MALGFLADMAAQAAPIAGGIGSLLSAFGFGKPKINYGPTPSEQQANSLLLALSQPNNSLVQFETEQNMQQGVNDLLMALKQRQMLDARRQGRGLRGTFFSPERADETIDYLTSRSIPALRAQATATAKGNILNRAQVLSGIGQQEAERRTQQQTNQQNQFQQFQTAGGFGGLGQGGLQGISNLFQALDPSYLPWQQAGNVRPSFLGGGTY